MSIVCLGWGSLIWNAGDLPLTSDWRYDGPQFPVEFARQSSNGRITLVVTEGAAPLTVFSAELGSESIERARTALAYREDIPAKFARRSVGHWTPASASDHQEADAVGLWAEAAGHQGVVWTALKPKFGKDCITPTCDQVVKYPGALSGETRSKAESYVRRAPTQIQTTYRAAIEQALGWTPLVDE